MAFSTGTNRGLEDYLRKHGAAKDNGPYVWRDKVELQQGRELGSYVEAVSEDFVKSSSGSVGEPLTTQDDASTGSHTLAFQDDTHYGEFEIKETSNDQAELGGVKGTTDIVNMSKSPIFEARVRLDPTPSGEDQFNSADQRMVVGLADTMGSNQTLDDVTTNAWFRVEGTNDDVLTESDDGSTDTDDNDTGFDLNPDQTSNGVYHTFKIDASNLSSVKFIYDGAEVATHDMSSLSADTGVFPVVMLQKDGGTEQPSLFVDYIQVHQER